MNALMRLADAHRPPRLRDLRGRQRRQRAVWLPGGCVPGSTSRAVQENQPLYQSLVGWGIEPPPSFKKRWTQQYWRWLRSLGFEASSRQFTFTEHLLAVLQADERVARSDEELKRAVACSPHAGLIEALQALRGFQVISAASVVAELGAPGRFLRPRPLMGYSGLAIQESSSGPRTRRGHITRTGNAHLRRILVEAAWHYRFTPRPSPALAGRRSHLPIQFTLIAEQAEQRLSRRFRRLVLRNHKLPQVAAVAVARELSGFIWSIIQTQQSTEAA